MDGCGEWNMLLSTSIYDNLRARCGISMIISFYIDTSIFSISFIHPSNKVLAPDPSPLPLNYIFDIFVYTV